ncbi:ATP-binding protein [Natronogracilivirga saccharolytica]|uniref:ATP-binding protein n=1 Tax=Natronogracilivirga saccharolytica TaxID=2812953 RepID=A0A8J7RNR5_9BACT|nr:ATP-binding protein [Natronogracilivirga saccharolytica]MBP3193129.1 ATP-binding protein [Natronogracilivirga saccharolytica]
MTDKKYSIQLASDPGEMDRLAEFVNEIAVASGADEDKKHNLHLALNEAVTNAILHGNKQDPAKVVRVTAVISRQDVTVTVTDQGDGFDPDAIPDPRKKENLMKTGGRGVWLLSEFADEVNYNKKGNSVELRFLL